MVSVPVLLQHHLLRDSGAIDQPALSTVGVFPQQPWLLLVTLVCPEHVVSDTWGMLPQVVVILVTEISIAIVPV